MIWDVRYYRFVNSTALWLVVFQSGSGYDYQQVPPKLYLALATATSVGLQFGKLVRGRYVTERLHHTEIVKFLATVGQLEHTNGLLTFGRV